MTTYFFKIIDYRNNLIGTGNFKVSKNMSELQKLNFFHEYTNGAYKNQLVKIEFN